MREIRHDNINQFIGAFVKPGRILIVTQFALRGSLEVCYSCSVIIFESQFKSSIDNELNSRVISRDSAGLSVRQHCVSVHEVAKSTME